MMGIVTDFWYRAGATLAQLDVSPLPNSSKNDAAQEAIPTVLSIVFGTVGAFALLMIVISGLRYITASGDPQKMAQAKNGVIYALIGLAVTITAFSIVTLVVRGIR